MCSAEALYFECSAGEPVDPEELVALVGETTERLDGLALQMSQQAQEAGALPRARLCRLAVLARANLLLILCDAAAS